MKTIGQRIKELRIEQGLTQAQLADELLACKLKNAKLSKSTIGMYEIGKREPSIEIMKALSDYFHVDMDYLLGKTDHKDRYAWLSDMESSGMAQFDNLFPLETKNLPLLGEIACGEPIFANEDRESYIAAGTNIDADFCLRAKGDSMTGARILDGDIVFIRKQDMVENGEIAAVIIDDSATLKRVFYYREKNLLILKPENPAYEDQIYMNEELDGIRILGKAVAFQSDVI